MIDLENQPDEDMTPAFKCICCKGVYCKDEINAKVKGGKWNDIICIYCASGDNK